MPEREFEKQSEQYARSKNLYLRGRNYIFDALELKYPGFKQSIEDKTLTEFIREVDAEDIDYLYWGSAGWFAAIAINVYRFGAYHRNTDGKGDDGQGLRAGPGLR